MQKIVNLKKMTLAGFSQVTYISNIFRLFPNYKSSILKCNFKYMSEKYINPISEKYIKSRLKEYFPIFSLKEVY